MEFSVKAGELSSALDVTGKVVSKSIVKDTENILLKVENEELSITASNVEQTVKFVITDVSFTSKGDVQLVVPHSILKDIVGSFNRNDDVLFRTDGTKLFIEQGKARYAINTLLTDNGFSETISEMIKTNNKKFSISADVLNSMIDAVFFAVAKKEETRREFRGVFFKAENGMLQTVGTDGTVLAVADRHGNIPDFSAIVPWKAIEVVRRAFNGSNDVVVYENERTLVFSNGNIAVSTLLVNGTFPPYGHIIPGDNLPFVEVPINDLTKSIKRISLISSKGNNKIRFNFKDNVLTLSAESTIGRGEESIACKGNVNETVIFYYYNVADVLQHVKGENAIFYITEPERPVKIKGDGENEEDRQYVIMPQRA